jgi:hypothetical protein
MEVVPTPMSVPVSTVIEPMATDAAEMADAVDTAEELGLKHGAMAEETEAAEAEPPRES